MSKKILQISPYTFDHPGGVEQYARILQELFPDEMITLAGGGEFPILEPVKNCPLPSFWKSGFWKIFQEINIENTVYIVSHIRFAPTSWLAYFLAWKKSIPYIHIEHGTGFLVHNNPMIAWVAKMVDLSIGKYIIRKAKYVICISEAGKEWVSKTFGRTENISVIYRGFDFPQVEQKENTIPKIGFVGRLTGLKNISGLLEALAQIKDEDWNLEIVGDGEERGNLESQTRQLGLSKKVSFLGAKSHNWIMSEFYPSVNIFINPSLQEGLPTTVIEALGMGCITIATDVGGTREITGVTLIPPANIDAIKNSLLESIKHPKKISYQPTQFSLENMKKRYKELFRK